MHIFCDESGGIGRGVMTLAAIRIEPNSADGVLSRFRAVTGIDDEVKGSRISLGERGFLFELLERTAFIATVSVAVSALRAKPGQDRGDQDVEVYAALLQDAVESLMPDGGDCVEVTIDDGRYSPVTLAGVRNDIGRLIGPCSSAALELSHRSAGLQLADVVANSFFTRALAGERQMRMNALLEPFLQSGRVKLQVLEGI